jgi:hypothetical protein
MAKKNTSWSAQQDAKLAAAVKARQCAACSTCYVADCPCETFKKQATWRAISQEVGQGRTYGACQGRWSTALDPHVDVSAWTPDMDARLLAIFAMPEFNTCE